MTKRLADKIAGLAQVLPIKHVAAWFGVSWDTVKQIDQRALVARLGPVDLSQVRQIAIYGERARPPHALRALAELRCAHR